MLDNGVLLAGIVTTYPKQLYLCQLNASCIYASLVESAKNLVTSYLALYIIHFIVICTLILTKKIRRRTKYLKN
jgi:tryptophan-rich sensory protein